jgi:hypothetical protein
MQTIDVVVHSEFDADQTAQVAMVQVEVHRSSDYDHTAEFQQATAVSDIPEHCGFLNMDELIAELISEPVPTADGDFSSAGDLAANQLADCASAMKGDNAHTVRCLSPDASTVIISSVSPQEIRPYPVSERSSSTSGSRPKRVGMKAQIVTSSPFKNELTAKQIKKAPKSAGKRKHNSDCNKGPPAKKLAIQSKKTGAKKRSPRVTEKTSEIAKPLLQDEEVVPCRGCDEVGGEEDWVKCNACSAWWHEACSSYSGSGGFICDFC